MGDQRKKLTDLKKKTLQSKINIKKLKLMSNISTVIGRATMLINIFKRKTRSQKKGINLGDLYTDNNSQKRGS